MKFLSTLFSLLIATVAFSQDIKNNPTSNHGNKFEALGTILPTPNVYRTASGAPGHEYYANRADYDISAYLDEDKRNLKGSETITYYNNSPDDLDYIWMQLDENQQSSVKNAAYDDSSTIPKVTTTARLSETILLAKDNGYEVNIEKITDVNATPLSYTVNKTVMRIDIHKNQKTGEKLDMKINRN